MENDRKASGQLRGRMLAGLAATGLLVLCVGLLFWGQAAPPLLPAAPRPAPAVATAAEPPVLPTAAAPPPSVSDAIPSPLPASNAFTTLADYSQRRAAAPQTPASLVPPPAGRTPETELGRAARLVRDYRAAYGANPVGSNREITRALLGDNPRGSRFLDPATAPLNARGELLDAWGRPYFFHALSGSVMEIRSAGPDGQVFTDDDLVR